MSDQLICLKTLKKDLFPLVSLCGDESVRNFNTCMQQCDVS